jgi:threonine/homoserine/homoserine lactone efflux protein
MNLTPYFAVLAALLVGAASPGPSFLIVARTSLGGSRRAGLCAAIGLGLGGVAYATIALAGLIALLAAVPWLYAALKIGGAVYLVYMAVRIWLSARRPIGVGDQASPLSGRAGLLRGVIVQVSNPKTAVVYASVFAALLPSPPNLVLEIALVPGVFVVEAGWYSLVALGFSLPVLRRGYTRAKVWIDRAASVVLAALAIRLLLTAGDRGL